MSRPNPLRRFGTNLNRWNLIANFTYYVYIHNLNMRKMLFNHIVGEPGGVHLHPPHNSIPLLVSYSKRHLVYGFRCSQSWFWVKNSFFAGWNEFFYNNRWSFLEHIFAWWHNIYRWNSTKLGRVVQQNRTNILNLYIWFFINLCLFEKEKKYEKIEFFGIKKFTLLFKGLYVDQY